MVRRYLEPFPAVARDQRGMDCRRQRYVVPLIITIEDGVLRMATLDEVLTTDGNQVTQLPAEGLGGGVELHGDTTLLNATSAERKD